MKKRYTFFIVFILAVSVIASRCKSLHNYTSEKAMYKSIYIDQFKLTYFRQLLIKSYLNSPAIQEIVNSDHSGFTEPILTPNDYTFIDSLTTVDSKKIHSDSTNSIGRVAEGAEGKHTLEFILYKLDSKWLYRLAKKRLRRIKKVIP